LRERTARGLFSAAVSLDPGWILRTMLDFVGGMNLSCLVVRIFILLLMLMANSTQYSVSG